MEVQNGASGTGNGISNRASGRTQYKIPARRFYRQPVVKPPPDRKTVISLIINGEPRSFDRILSCSELVGELGLAGKRIAMERNGEIVPRSQYGLCTLRDGDRLEIVAAVGGG